MFPATYHHEYHQSLVYKIMVSRKRPGSAALSADTALQIIAKIAELTHGLKQIVYLVGWQFEGHDSKYPAWSQVNERFKRPQDADARDSLLWLMEAAKEFNAVVSLHINMDDAYPSSPLWDPYIENDLIRTDENGVPKDADVWDGELSYHVSKTREWKSGWAKKRIDALLDFLPPLRDAGTIHIDAFRPQPVAKHESETFEDEMETAQQILLYWRTLGLDVTTEFFSYHQLAGLLPMAWHFNADENTRLKYPPAVLCGGASDWNQRSTPLHRFPPWTGNFATPEAGCKFDEAWGHTFVVDVVSVEGVEKLVKPFCTKTAIWHFLNHQFPIQHTHTAQNYSVEFSGGARTNVRIADRYLNVHQGDRLLVDGGDGCIPALWRQDQSQKAPCEHIAWSQNGGHHEWVLSEEWNRVQSICTVPLSPFAIPNARTIPIRQGRIELELAPGEMLWITSAKSQS